MSGQLDIFKFSDVPSTSELRCVPPGEGIKCSRAVLCQVGLTFSNFQMYPVHVSSDVYHLVEASSVQEQYYVRSS